MRTNYDWTVDEAPEIKQPVKASVNRGRALRHAGNGTRRGARRFHKPRANRVQRRAIRELLATGIEPRGISVTFTSWDII